MIFFGGGASTINNTQLPDLPLFTPLINTHTLDQITIDRVTCSQRAISQGAISQQAI